MPYFRQKLMKVLSIFLKKISCQSCSVPPNVHRIPSPLPSIGTQTRQVIVFFPRRRSPFSYFKEVQVSWNPTFQFWFWQRRNATRRNKDSKKHLACVNYGHKWPTASLTHCHPVCQTWRFRGSIMSILRRKFAIRVSNLTRLSSLG